MYVLAGVAVLLLATMAYGAVVERFDSGYVVQLVYYDEKVGPPTLPDNVTVKMVNDQAMQSFAQLQQNLVGAVTYVALGSSSMGGREAIAKFNLDVPTLVTQPDLKILYNGASVGTWYGGVPWNPVDVAKWAMGILPAGVVSWKPADKN